MSPAQLTPAAPFLILGDTRRHALAQRIGTLIGRWRQSWAGEGTAQFFVDIPEAGIQSSASGWYDGLCFCAGSAHAPDLAWLVPARCLPGIVGIAGDRADSWAQVENKGTLAARLQLEALRALTTEMLGTASSEATVLERVSTSVDDLLRELNAKRYVAARIALGAAKATFGLMLAPSVAAALMPSRSSAPLPEHITKRRAAVTSQLVAIEAVLGDAEVSLQELATLAVGDVILLNKRVGELSQIVVRDGECLVEGALGHRDGQRAIRIESTQPRRS